MTPSRAASLTLATATVATPLGALILRASPQGLREVCWPGCPGDEPSGTLSQQENLGVSRVPRSRHLVHGVQPAVRPQPARGEPVSSQPPHDDAATAVAAAPARRIVAAAAAQLAEYFAGGRTTFDLPLDPLGTPFQVATWEILRMIPFGTTISYAEQARRLGDTRKARAVGSANGKNPLPIVVPCHRVIGSGGGLVGFAAGTGAKAWLLDHERAVATRSSPGPATG